MKENIILVCVLTIFMAGCGNKASENSASIEPSNEPQIIESGEGKVRISEVMSKNNSTLRLEDGSYPDWIELENCTNETIDLDGWYLSDKESGGTQLSNVKIDPYGRIIVYADKLSSTSTEVHVGFGIKEGETVYLKDKNDDVVSSVEIDSDVSDFSIAYGEGDYMLCKYPTPGLDNTIESYISIQETIVANSPIQINEVCVANFKNYDTGNDDIGRPDWVEIKNVSTEEINMSDYYLSDDNKNPGLYNLPDSIIYPGEIKIILCDKNASEYTGTYPMAPFSLNDESDSLYLTRNDGTLMDMVSLKNIPYNCTFGRIEGENGFFYFNSATPGEINNTEGKRYVCSTPTSNIKDGIYNDVNSVKVELYSDGEIYYTLDSTVPDSSSIKYKGPIELTQTTIVRAVSVKNNAVDSTPLTLSFIINEEHSLPVVSLVSDDKPHFNSMYSNGYKLDETPGQISYFDDQGSFSIGCGIKMHGDTSLTLFKPGVSVRFRGAYGQPELNYDLFDGGITTFTNLLLRGGQDQLDTIVRNEAIINMAMQYTNSLVCQRNKYCVLYVDGVYKGIRSLMEKSNEQLYASHYGVDKDSVVENEAAVYTDDLFYEEVVYDVIYGDMSDDEQYNSVCSKLDINSLIDWVVIEGWSGNFDLASGNLRYIKSTENDGKWRLELYDLDCALINPEFCFAYVTNYPNQIGQIVMCLLDNNNFREKFFTRANELITTAFTNENTIAELNRLYEIIDSEVARDEEISTMSYEQWKKHTQDLEIKIRDNDWANTAIDLLCDQACVTEEERAKYFGQ